MAKVKCKCGETEMEFKHLKADQLTDFEADCCEKGAARIVARVITHGSVEAENEEAAMEKLEADFEKDHSEISDLIPAPKKSQGNKKNKKADLE